MTHKQFVGWQGWFFEDLNTPSRNDHYLLEILTELRRMFAKNPAQVPRAEPVRFISPAEEEARPKETAEEFSVRMLGLWQSLTSPRKKPK